MPEDVDAGGHRLEVQGRAGNRSGLDVADGPALAAWVADVAAELGGIDIVVSQRVARSPSAATTEHWQQWLPHRHDGRGSIS